MYVEIEYMSSQTFPIPFILRINSILSNHKIISKLTKIAFRRILDITNKLLYIVENAADSKNYLKAVSRILITQSYDEYTIIYFNMLPHIMSIIM